MNRTDLQQLAHLRLEEAKALLAAGFPAGAYYLAGYTIECAIKACIARGVQQYEFPDKGRVLRSYSHDFTDLLRAAELRTTLDETLASNAALAAKWAIVKEWKESARYNPGQRPAAASDMIAAVSAANNGVLSWRMAHW